MLPQLNGATRLYVIVGDPIEQVKAPGGVTAAFQARGHDGVLVPVHVSPVDLPSFMSAAEHWRNLDGLIVTVPHKFACLAHCATLSARARTVGAVNIMRRRPDGSWHGDMIDGLGFVAAARARGFDPAGRRALLIGAGGAGSAIGEALLTSGVRELAIYDADTSRRDALLGRLAAVGAGRCVIGSPNPAGFDFVGNATPAGMRADDALPVDLASLAPTTFVACVVTVPAVTPLIAAARQHGCRTSTGIDMYQASERTMVDFFLDAG